MLLTARGILIIIRVTLFAVEFVLWKRDAMPIYEYRCLDCGNMFEKIVALGTEEMACSSCASAHVEKLLSTFAVQASHYSPCGTKDSACGSCGVGQQGMCHGIN
jgi:putative FmdB family regulatory protein